MLNKERLMQYIKEKFPGTIDANWNWDLLENIIDYSIECKSYSEGQLTNFLTDIIPEITEEEILKFVE